MRRGCIAVVTAVALWGVAAAPASASPGDVYVVDEDADAPTGDGGVFRIGAAGGAATPIAQHPSFSNPRGMALLRDGRLVLTDYSAQDLFVVDPATGQTTQFDGGTQLDDPVDVATGPDGTVLVASLDNDKVVRFNPATGQFSPFADLPVNALPWTLVATRDGGAYVGSDESSADPKIYRVSPAGVVTTFIESIALERPRAMAITPDEGTLYVAADNSNAILTVDLPSGAIAPRATLPIPNGVSLFPDGGLLATARTIQQLQRIPAGSGEGVLFSEGPPLSWPGDTVIEPARCGGRVPTLVGTTGRDVLQGSQFADVISALGGNDKINGLAGNDVVCGGPGRDTLKGGKGNDRLLGQAGKDVLIGGKGKDRVKGGKGKDKERP